MSPAFWASASIAILFGSAITIQIFVFPSLINRNQDRSAVTRISNTILQGHHTMSVILLLAASALFFVSGMALAACLSALLLMLNLYQRFWVFTKLHLVRQPIGVQDLIQPDNVLREESNRLQQVVYRLYRIHLLLLLIDLVAAAF